MTGRERYHSILAKMAQERGLDLDKLQGTCRQLQYVWARFEAWFRMRTETTLSYKQLAKIVGRDHSSVVAGVERYMRRNGITQDGPVIFRSVRA